MLEILKDMLISWNATNSERKKLQHTYLVLTVLITLVAGVVSLIDGNMGHNIIIFALIAVVAFFANAVVWNLLQSSLLDKIPKKPKRK